MSVIVITKFSGRAADLERVATGEHADTLRRIAEDGKSKGAIHHQFVEDVDGNVMVVDEWQSEEAFNAFFATQEEIRKVTADAGVTGPPTSTAYRVVDTPDRF